MNREEAARRYLQADMAANALPSEKREGREIHEETKRKLAERHPQVRRHATVGEGKDFDEPLNRNELEHQRLMRRRARLTNPQIAAQRRELREGDYGRHSASEIFAAANPDRRQAKPRAGRAGAQRRRSPSRRRARSIPRTVQSSAPSPVKETTQIFWELLIAGIAISMLYLILKSSEGGSGVVGDTLKGITGAFSRLADPNNNLFSPAAKASTQVTGAVSAPGATPSKPQVGVSSNKALAEYAAKTKGVFGPLPSYATVSPTIP